MYKKRRNFCGRTSLEMLYEVSVFEMEDLLKYIYILREKLEKR